MLKTIIGCWFQPRRVCKYFLIFSVMVLLDSCFQEKNTPVEPPSDKKVKLDKVEIKSLPGWDKDNFAEVIPVFAKNCKYILQNNNEYIYNATIKLKTSGYKDTCNKFTNSAVKSASDMKRFLEENFVSYAVSDDGNPEGKFTSYYEATIYASYNKDARYKYPIYGKPTDLVETNPRDFDENLPDVRLVGRVENGRFVPYFNRREIEKNGINAPVLMWGDSLVDIHFMQIQGSAIAKMSDGKDIRIGYADNNGHKFRGIGGILLAKGEIKPEDASMVKIREWLRKNPQKAENLMAENERFIFQKLTNADGPVGAMGISLTAGRSLAVDNKYIPLGAMMWLDTYTPDNDKLQKIVFAQDVGSAIKGVVRGDYFWGHGEEALAQAGRMNSGGRYYILAPKNSIIGEY